MCVDRLRRNMEPDRLPAVFPEYLCLDRSVSWLNCDVCGNDYDKAFRVTQGDRTMTFDSFECAIDAMAPRCAHCGCRVIGHGTELKGKIYCCAHCAKQAGVKGVDDRAD